MEKEKLMTVFIAVLVLVSAVQAVQLITLNGKVQSGEISTRASAQSTSGTTDSGSGSGTQLPQNIQNLPSMVGGC